MSVSTGRIEKALSCNAFSIRPFNTDTVSTLPVFTDHVDAPSTRPVKTARAHG